MKLTPSRIMVLLLLVVGVLIAAYVGKRLLATDEPEVVVQTRTVPMLVADVEPGTLVTEQHVGLGRMKVTDLQNHPGMLIDRRAVINRVAREKITAGRPIIAKQLYQPGELPPLQVDAGKRAVSLSLGERVKLIDGRVKPGQYVDVHMTATNDNDKRFHGGLTLTLFKGVRVLTVNNASSNLGQLGRTGNSVTLELTPMQSNMIILAQKKGDLTLSYNPEGAGNGGVAVASEDRAMLDEILGLKPIPEPPKPFEVEAYRGSGRSVLQYRDGKLLRQSDRWYDRTNQTDRDDRNNGGDRNARPSTGPQVNRGRRSMQPAA